MGDSDMNANPESCGDVGIVEDWLWDFMISPAVPQINTPEIFGASHQTHGHTETLAPTVQKFDRDPCVNHLPVCTRSVWSKPNGSHIKGPALSSTRSTVLLIPVCLWSTWAETFPMFYPDPLLHRCYRPHLTPPPLIYRCCLDYSSSGCAPLDLPVMRVYHLPIRYGLSKSTLKFRPQLQT